MSREKSAVRTPRSPVGHGPAAAAYLLLMPCLLTPPAGAFELGKEGRAELSADFRLRFEADFDSQTAAGTARDDRNRVRVRARVNLSFAATESLELGVRLRSGSDASHQSPHVTVIDFDDNDTGDAHFNLDKWYLKGGRDKVSGWVGRNSFPFWKQNEFFWDDDATPAGLAAAFANPVGENGKVTLNLAYLSPPVGLREFAGNLAGGQVVYSRSGEPAFTLAAGYFGFDANPNDADAATLLRGNGFRDYRILVGNAQLELGAGKRPLALGLDYMHNAESYSATDPDPFTAANRDQTDGFAVSAVWGQTESKGDWLVGYYYAEVETFAVNSSYSQDDWVRWGSAVETRGSDYRGHELRYARALGAGINLMARLYLVEAITTREDGNRFRVDVNYRF